MSQLEPMMAEENKNADAYDGRDGDEAFLVALPVSGYVFQDVCRINTRGAVANSTRAPKRGWVLRGVVSECTQFQTPVFVWGKRIMVNIEGGKKITIN